MAVLHGLITFYSWHHTLRAEKMLKKAAFQVLLIPAPRELSPNCGTALRFEYHRRPEAMKVLADSKVRVEATHHYVPELEAGGQGEGPDNSTAFEPVESGALRHETNLEALA